MIYTTSISGLKSIITENIKHVLCENDMFNIKNVYHVSADNFNKFMITDKRFPYIFFSSMPIELHKSPIVYQCNLSIHNPFIFEHGEAWSYPLWLFLTDRNGNLIPEEMFTPDKYDGYLGCPYEFWKMVYYDTDEYEMDQIPYLVKRLDLGYDGVIIKNVDEGNTSLTVDDYVVFEPSQVQIVKKYMK